MLYYERHLASIDEDHLILTFQLNDFTSTPITFVANDGSVVLYEARLPLRTLSPFFLEHSFVYRFYVGATLEHRSPYGFEEEIAGEVQDALIRLKELTDERGSRLSVILLPWLRPRETWPAGIEERYRRAKQVLGGLGVPVFDLLPTLEEAVATGVPLGETPADADHPSDEFSALAARQILGDGFVP